ncbi:MAG: Hsp20/alpha crystallin family protein [Rhizobacter sp.]|nr:Hsp20/alpha crystallin family protein [Rhizobacter sp.]
MFALNTRPAASVAGARDPFSLMDSLFSDWLSARPTSTLVSNARIEVSEKDGSYEVRAELPGATKDDISVEVEGVRVSISAKTNSQSEKKEGEKVLYSERTHESYARSFELPQAVDSDAAVAKFENGVLTLTLPKKDAPKTRRLAVQ